LFDTRDSSVARAPADAPAVWESALGVLELAVNKSNYRTWFARTTGLAYRDGVFTVGVPNAFVAAYLEKNQRSLIEKTIIDLTEPGIRLVFAVAGGDTAAAPAVKPPRPCLNSRYTFAAFIAGSGNNLAKASAMEVARHPGQSYNPLYIYSACGLGKTHLLHAIGHAAGGDGHKVLYVSAERFTNEFVQALRQRRTEDFHQKYRHVDMLLVDDVQFLAGKAQTEESFFHTFNELHNTGRQIVLTCDCPPGTVPIAERLRSRFHWGLTVDIQPPDEVTRRAILDDKAAEYGIILPPEVGEFIASRAVASIRELEGALNRLVAYQRLVQQPLTAELARRSLRSVAGQGAHGANGNGNGADGRRVLALVAESFQLPGEDLIGRRRDQRTALARQVAMYILKQESGDSLARIGSVCGGRDHSTVLHAVAKIDREIIHNAELARIVGDIRQRLAA